MLHDYKPSVEKKPQKSKALQWFVVGLGIPLAGLALVSTLNMTTPVTPPPQEPILTAVKGTEIDIEAPADLIFAAVPLVLAEAINPPPYQKATLTIRRGDTLDKLFRKHDLNLGDLSRISKLEEARKRFRQLKPGDEFMITHDQGDLVSMYTNLDLTSTLKIERAGSGFTAEVIERPIEKRKRLAYGVIESSLFESAAAAGLSDRVIMNIAGIFAWDVDFVLDIRKGDNYYVQYEEIWQNGEFVKDGEIIAAEFNNNGRKSQAIRFIDDAGRSDYFMLPTTSNTRKRSL